MALSKEFLIRKKDFNGKTYSFVSLSELFKFEPSLEKLPFSMRIVLENLIRKAKDNNDIQKSVSTMLSWLSNAKNQEIEFYPSRILMQDFTGVPAIVDLAAMRDAALKYKACDPTKVNPLIPVDLVVDHSVQANHYGNQNALKENIIEEYEQNSERYQFLKWGQQAFRNFRVVPPGMGICHQVNLEYLASVIFVNNDDYTIYPETIIGTDSHTTMINGLAVLGWGVGGIEAEAVMLGESISMVLPEVIGFKLIGNLKEGVTATDLVLTITQMLREKKVVGKFVEFFGEGLSGLSLPDRATIANMAPEYGATCGFFPIDQKTIDYLTLSNRNEEHIKLIEQHAKSEMLWNIHEDLKFTDTIELDLSSVRASLAGPTRPQDKCFVEDIHSNFNKVFGNSQEKYQVENHDFTLQDGQLVLAAITSCTNTSNPSVLIAAALVAQKAIEKGLLSSKPWVKTSFAPGSGVVSEYLKNAGLQQYLDQLGFNIVGYGCTTCIGNSGPLIKEIEETIIEHDLSVGSVLSGNRNFEGRIHPLIKANYLGSPPLVVAFALCGTLNLNLLKDPIGEGFEGKKIYLKDIWPTNEEIQKIIDMFVTKNLFEEKYSTIFDGEELWKQISITEGQTYQWDNKSTYIQNPPYFNNFLGNRKNHFENITGARVLALLGDSITTDHISPAGNIKDTTPAGLYLNEQGITKSDFNSYGSRRGNHEVMMRGTFANVRLKNEMVSPREGGFTLYDNKEMSIYDASMLYMSKKTPLVIFAGKDYGSGSSRDWAAKGPYLLGVKAIIAESFERIHRSNLVGMGVIPMVFANPQDTKKTLNITGNDIVDIIGLDQITEPQQKIQCILHKSDGSTKAFEVIVRIDTKIELETMLYGGIMQKVLVNLGK